MPALPELQVLVGDEADAVSGRCVQLESAQEQLLVSVEFALGAAPVLALGRSVEVEFRSRDLERSIHTEALVVQRADEASRRTYGLRCAMSKRVFLGLLNRRRVPRVPVLPGDAPVVRVLDVAEPAPVATLHDLSAIGLSIGLEASLEARLFERAHLELELDLPGEPGPLRLMAVVRHRKLVDACVHYGLQIVAGLPELAASRHRYEQYVASRVERASAGTRFTRGRRGTG